MVVVFANLEATQDIFFFWNPISANTVIRAQSPCHMGYQWCGVLV